MQGLAEAWCRFRDDDDAWVGILTGAGRAFCAGLDVKEAVASGRIQVRPMRTDPPDPFWEYQLDKPTIAAVNGLAWGGGIMLVIRADLRVAAESATFQLAEVARGGMAGWDWELWENLPYAVLAELAAAGTLTARRAYEVGLVNRVVPDGQVMEAALDMARELINKPPLAVHYNLKLLRDLKRSRMVIGHRLWDQARRYGQELQGSHDMKEAMLSFVEKRPPVYQRR